MAQDNPGLQDHLNEMLISACMLDDRKMAQEAIDAGADVNHISRVTGISPVHKAVIICNGEMIEFLALAGADLNALSQQGLKNDLPVNQTPMMMAYRSPQLVGVLLAHGANPDIQEPENRFTVMHLAALANQVETVNILLRHGARRDILDRVQHTPLDRARVADATEIIDLITAYEAAEQAHCAIDSADSSRPRPL